jgi:hypothetical protein
MTYAAESGYEFFGDIEIRIFQETADPIGSGFEQQRSIFSEDAQSLNTTYRASFRLPDGDSYTCSLPDLPSEELLKEMDPRNYGLQLFSWLFDERMQQTYMKIRQGAKSFSGDTASNFSGLRLRLWLDPYSIKLHRLWWEAMYDLESDLPMSATMAFSRFMRVHASEGAILEGPLRFLLVASNPEGLGRFDLTEINVSLERSIVSHATKPLQDKLEVTRLMPNVTLEALSAMQSEGKFHIVHMLAHTVFHGDQGYMILADSEGKGQEVPPPKVVEALTRSGEPPHLVFLATPLTAGEDAPTLVSMSPLFVDAGTRAAVAIQGPISEERLSSFCNCFYETLIQTGVIDLALMDARAKIYDPSDWEWANPVLYMRSPDGQLFRPLPESLRELVSAAGAL